MNCFKGEGSQEEMMIPEFGSQYSDGGIKKPRSWKRPGFWELIQQCLDVHIQTVQGIVTDPSRIVGCGGHIGTVGGIGAG